MLALSNRITIEPGKRGGKPCIPSLRITVWDVPGWLGAGTTEEQILEEHPDIERQPEPPSGALDRSADSAYWGSPHLN